uniref:Uncharacterized protein n=1 Tax=Panagrolaimus davidi TaxID=227884 RepID=A0A914PCT5_9BILA
MSFGDTLTTQINIQAIWSFKKVELKNDTFDPSLNYLLEYDECGLMKIQDVSINPFDIFNNFGTGNQKVQVWSAENKQMGSFNFEKGFVQLGPLSLDLKNLIAYDLLNDEEQVVKQLTAMHSDLVAVFVDQKLNSYRNGPIISVAPSYIGLLQYCLTFFQPTCPKILILIVTKTASKMYALNQRTQFCYTVTYCSNLTQTYINSSITGGYPDVGLFYLTEKGSSKYLFFEPEFKYQFVKSDIESCNETIVYGGAIYALQNSNTTLTSPYVTIDPLFDPEENNIEGISTL